MILVRKDLTVIPVPDIVTQSKDDFWIPCVVRLKSISLALISCYMHPDDTHKNVCTQSGISTWLGMFKGVYLVAGDMNKTPIDIQDQEWEVSMRGCVIVPTNTAITCTAGIAGSLIDYGFGSSALEYMLDSVLARYDLPFKTHLGIEYVFKDQINKILANQLVQPKDLPNMDVHEKMYEPIPWEQCMKLAIDGE